MIIAWVSKCLWKLTWEILDSMWDYQPLHTDILYKDQDIATRARPLHWKTVPNQTIDRQGFPTVWHCFWAFQSVRFTRHPANFVGFRITMSNANANAPAEADLECGTCSKWMRSRHFHRFQDCGYGYGWKYWNALLLSHSHSVVLKIQDEMACSVMC